ncbi:MAG: FAD:protein FMN transferase [Chloroflexi bacterium]|nr:FAD:protein FMN transferase [Chloroflexota bacterium]
MRTINFEAMGSRVNIVLDADEEGVYVAALRARDWFEQWEQSLSRFRLTSELSEVNRHHGFPVKVSHTFMEVLTLSLSNEAKTGGLVTPTILNDLEGAGYTGTFENIADQIGSVLRRPAFFSDPDARIEIDPENQTVTLPFGTRIDFGGVGKGWAAHQTMLRLKDLSPLLVDAGGDISISGPRRDGTEWPIAVANPFDKDRPLELLMLSRGGVATSGRDYRRWTAGGAPQHHLIDPRSHAPANTDILTATVVAENVMDAEVNAKMGLILGSLEGSTWLESQPHLEYLLVLENGKSIKNQEFIKKQWNELWPQLTQNLSI